MSLRNNGNHLCNELSHFYENNCNMRYVYILRCADETFYTGMTKDLERRCDEHNGDCK